MEDMDAEKVAKDREHTEERDRDLEVAKKVVKEAAIVAEVAEEGAKAVEAAVEEDVKHVGVRAPRLMRGLLMRRTSSMSSAPSTSGTPRLPSDDKVTEVAKFAKDDTKFEKAADKVRDFEEDSSRDIQEAEEELLKAAKLLKQ